MSTTKAIIETTQDLPSPPAIALHILSAVKDDDSSFEDLAQIVKADPALSTQILKMANSSLYGLVKKVDSLSQATAMIGVKTLKNIALSFVVVKNFEQSSIEGFDIDAFWRKSITTGVAAELLSKKIGIKSSDVFVTGLLQDIGILIMFSSRPGESQKIIDEQRVSGDSLWQVEEQFWGFNHGQVGAQLLENWNLPESIHLPIRNHHTTDNAAEFIEIAKILHFSDKVSSIYHGTEPNKKVQEAHEYLDTVYQIEQEDAVQLIDLVGEKAKEMMDLFSIDAQEMKPISVIMQESNDELRKLNLSYEQVVFELQQAKQNAEKLALDLKAANEKLRDLAFYDELTGLHNHRSFQQAMDDELYRAQRFEKPLSVMLVDIDFFKKVNDTHGHLVGDFVLKEVAKQMKKLVRQSDFVARYGGEEFALILPETAISGGKVIGQRIRRGVEQLEITHENVKIPVTISLGLAGCELESIGHDKTTLLTRCDEALYLAKNNGRNRLEAAVA